ncbi:MAG: hypothetical protein AAFY71_15445 [Bacteroidota bacterium]
MKNIYRIFLVALIGLAGCQLQPFKNVDWEADIVAPVAFTSLTIWDVITDSSAFELGSDQLLNLVYRDTVLSLEIQDLIEIPDTVRDFAISLDTLNLSSDTITTQISLGQLARQLLASSDPADQQIGQIILLNQGNTLFFFPGINGLSSDAITIDASDFFESAVLSDGDLVLTIENNFPLNLTNVIFSIENANLATEILRDTFETIAKGTEETRTYPLDGKEIESSLAGQLENLDVGADALVPIDTNDFIEIRLIARNLKAETATAIFPAQTIVDTVTERTYVFTGDFEDVALTKLVVSAGQIRADAVSTVEDTILFEYELPNAVDDEGNTPSIIVKMPPAPPGGTSTKSEVVSLNGFTMDLTGEGDNVNTLLERITVSTVFSGKLVTLEQSDSVKVDFALESLEPIYLEGYIGNTKLSFSGEEAISVFNELDVDKIQFSDASADIILANSIGLPSELTVKNFTASNSVNNDRVRLANSDLVAGPLTVKAPALPDTNVTMETVLALTPENSNINTFISSLADLVSYDVELETNPNGDRTRLDNFITDASALDVLLDFKLPLKGLVENLVFVDTVDFETEMLEIDGVTAGGLKLIITNDFPFEVEVFATVIDENGNVVRDLANGDIFQASEVDQNGVLLTASVSELSQSLDIDELNDLLDRGRKLAFRFVMNTKPDGQNVPIYSNYSLSAKLVGDFSYSLSN